jgi:uncharacterized protein (TIGR02145 family)
MRNVLTKVLCIGALGVLFGHSTLAQQEKYALVIGAQNYTSLPPLRNSLSDARDLTSALRAKGFKVETLIDPKTKREVKDAIIRYQTAMQNVDGGVGIIFYAGHGMQFEGNNYIIPTTAKLELSSDLDDQCLKMNAVMAVLNSTNKSLNILFLDACRSIPSFNRDSEQGWTKVNAPRGSIIVFATEAGKVASDGNEKNGLFTSKLLTRINEPGLNITDVLKRVKQDVFMASGEKQLPSLEDNSIGGDFFFTPQLVVRQSSASISTENKRSAMPIVKTEFDYVTPETSAFDYGYGTADVPVIKVGDQEWLGKNLNVDRFSNGDRIPEAITEEEWKHANDSQQPAWCYLNNRPANGRAFGRLYNWYAVNDPRGLAPKGWHVPSDAEWDVLVRHLAENGVKLNQEFFNMKDILETKDVGDKLKSIEGWAAGNKGTNSSKFAGLPGGLRPPDGVSGIVGSAMGIWWSSSELPTGTISTRYLTARASGVLKTYTEKGSGCSVRCVRD